MDSLEKKLKEYTLEPSNSDQSSAIRGIHQPTNRKVNLAKLVVRKNSNRYTALVEGIKSGSIYVYDMFSAETKNSIYVYIILPVNDPISKNLCSLENALNQELHQSRKALIFKNIVVLLKTLHQKNIAHLALDLKNIWIEDLFYVYLGPFSFEEKKDELDTALPFAAPEILLCQDYSYSSKACDLWALGIIYCCLKFKGFYDYILSNIHSLEDYLIFFDLLIGYPQTGGLSYMPPKTFKKLKRLITKFKVDQDFRRKSKKSQQTVFDTDETVFDEDLIANWAEQINQSELLTKLLHFESTRRLSCDQILEFDLFKADPGLASTKNSNVDLDGTVGRIKNLNFNTNHKVDTELNRSFERRLEQGSMRARQKINQRFDNIERDRLNNYTNQNLSRKGQKFSDPQTSYKSYQSLNRRDGNPIYSQFRSKLRFSEPPKEVNSNGEYPNKGKIRPFGQFKHFKTEETPQNYNNYNNSYDKEYSYPRTLSKSPRQMDLRNSQSNHSASYNTSFKLPPRNSHNSYSQFVRKSDNTQYILITQNSQNSQKKGLQGRDKMSSSLEKMKVEQNRPLNSLKSTYNSLNSQDLRDLRGRNNLHQDSKLDVRSNIGQKYHKSGSRNRKRSRKRIQPIAEVSSETNLEKRELYGGINGNNQVRRGRDQDSGTGRRHGYCDDNVLMSSDQGVNLEKLQSSMNSSLNPRDLGLVETQTEGIMHHAHKLKKSKEKWKKKSKNKFDKHSSKHIILFNQSSPTSELLQSTDKFIEYNGVVESIRRKNSQENIAELEQQINDENSENDANLENDVPYRYSTENKKLLSEQQKLRRSKNAESYGREIDFDHKSGEQELDGEQLYSYEFGNSDQKKSTHGLVDRSLDIPVSQKSLDLRIKEKSISKGYGQGPQKIQYLKGEQFSNDEREKLQPKQNKLSKSKFDRSSKLIETLKSMNEKEKIEGKSLPQKLRSLLNDKQNPQVKNFPKIRILVCTREVIFSRTDIPNLKDAYLKGIYTFQFEPQEQEIEQEAITTVIQKKITPFDSNFEVVVNYSEWQELLEAKLDLILTISKEELGDNIFIGSARFDLESLVFSFFNGRETDTAMEKRLIGIKQDEDNIIGVMQIAIGISTILEDIEGEYETTGEPTDRQKDEPLDSPVYVYPDDNEQIKNSGSSKRVRRRKRKSPRKNLKGLLYDYRPPSVPKMSKSSTENLNNTAPGLPENRLPPKETFSPENSLNQERFSQIEELRRAREPAPDSLDMQRRSVHSSQVSVQNLSLPNRSPLPQEKSELRQSYDEIYQKMNKSVDADDRSRSKYSKYSRHSQGSKRSFGYSQPDKSSAEYFSNEKIVEQIHHSRHQSYGTALNNPSNPRSRKSRTGGFHNENEYSKTYSHGQNRSDELEELPTSKNNDFIVVQEGKQPSGLKAKLTSLNRSYPSLQGSNRDSIGSRNGERRSRNSLRSRGSKRSLGSRQSANSKGSNWEEKALQKLKMVQSLEKNEQSEMMRKLQEDFKNYNSGAISDAFKAFAQTTKSSSLNNSYAEAVNQLRGIVYQDENNQDFANYEEQLLQYFQLLRNKTELTFSPTQSRQASKQNNFPNQHRINEIKLMNFNSQLT